MLVQFSLQPTGHAALPTSAMLRVTRGVQLSWVDSWSNNAEQGSERIRGIEGVVVLVGFMLSGGFGLGGFRGW